MKWNQIAFNPIVATINGMSIDVLSPSLLLQCHRLQPYRSATLAFGAQTESSLRTEARCTLSPINGTLSRPTSNQENIHEVQLLKEALTQDTTMFASIVQRFANPQSRTVEVSQSVRICLYYKLLERTRFGLSLVALRHIFRSYIWSLDDKCLETGRNILRDVQYLRIRPSRS